MLRNIRPNSNFSTRFIALVLCYGIALSQLAMIPPMQAFAAGRMSEKGKVISSDSSARGEASADNQTGLEGTMWLNPWSRYFSNSGGASQPLPDPGSSSQVVISQVYGGGDPEPQETDFLRNPDGHGWHLDRARFEQWLRDIAMARGAELLSPATVNGLECDGRRWRVLLKTPAGARAIMADLIIDGGGRAAPACRLLGARPRISDRLICAWLYGRDSYHSGHGLTYVEAVEDGWWYTAPIPGGRRVLAFHTDGDLPSSRFARAGSGLLEHARASEELSAHLADVGFVADTETRVTAANSVRLEPAAGSNWLAVGDAALSFDPISSQGIYNAMFTGLAAAEAAHRYLRGDALSLSGYAQTMQGVWDAYRGHLDFYYAAERRWVEAPFWRRRHTRRSG